MRELGFIQKLRKGANHRIHLRLAAVAQRHLHKPIQSKLNQCRNQHLETVTRCEHARELDF